MRLLDFPEVIAELEKLATNDNLDIESEEVKNCSFYQMIQNEEVLDISEFRNLSNIILIISKIAATSPSLHTVNVGRSFISFNNLDINSLEALSKSNNIKNLNIEEIGLGTHGIKAAPILSNWKSLKVLDISYNAFINEAPLVAEELLKSTNLDKIIFKAYNTMPLLRKWNVEAKKAYDSYKAPIVENNNKLKEGVFLLFANRLDEKALNEDINLLPNEILVSEILGKMEHLIEMDF